MDSPYVERRSTGFYLSGTRVPIDCVVHEYWKGEPAECIRQHYPTLTLEQVHGAIAFYLGHQAEVDSVLRERAKQEVLLRANQVPPLELKAKLTTGMTRDNLRSE